MCFGFWGLSSAVYSSVSTDCFTHTSLYFSSLDKKEAILEKLSILLILH